MREQSGKARNLGHVLRWQGVGLGMKRRAVGSEAASHGLAALWAAFWVSSPVGGAGRGPAYLPWVAGLATDAPRKKASSCWVNSGAPQRGGRLPSSPLQLEAAELRPWWGRLWEGPAKRMLVGACLPRSAGQCPLLGEAVWL